MLCLFLLLSCDASTYEWCCNSCNRASCPPLLRVEMHALPSPLYSLPLFPPLSPSISLHACCARREKKLSSLLCDDFFGCVAALSGRAVSEAGSLFSVTDDARSEVSACDSEASGYSGTGGLRPHALVALTAFMYIYIICIYILRM